MQRYSQGRGDDGGAMNFYFIVVLKGDANKGAAP